MLSNTYSNKVLVVEPFSDRQHLVDLSRGGLDLLEATAPDHLGAGPVDARVGLGQYLQGVANRLGRLLLVLAGAAGH